MSIGVTTVSGKQAVFADEQLEKLRIIFYGPLVL